MKAKKVRKESDNIPSLHCIVYIHVAEWYIIMLDCTTLAVIIFQQVRDVVHMFGNILVCTQR